MCILLVEPWNRSIYEAKEKNCGTYHTYEQDRYIERNMGTFFNSFITESSFGH